MLSTFNVRTRGQWGPQAPSADLTSPAPVMELGMQVCQVSKGRVREEGKNTREKKHQSLSATKPHSAFDLLHPKALLPGRSCGPVRPSAGHLPSPASISHEPDGGQCLHSEDYMCCVSRGHNLISALIHIFPSFFSKSVLYSNTERGKYQDGKSSCPQGPVPGPNQRG